MLGFVEILELYAAVEHLLQARHLCEHVLELRSRSAEDYSLPSKKNSSAIITFIESLGAFEVKEPLTDKRDKLPTFSSTLIQ